jgi:hypothetical protein
MSAIQFVIGYPDGRTEQLRIDGERAVLGSAAHCEIRVARELAEPEVLLFEQHGEEIFVRALSATSSPLLDGVPFRHSNVAPESVIAVGLVQLRVGLEAKGADAPRVTSQNERSPRVYLLAALVAGAAVYVFTHRTSEPPTLTIPSDAPALWADAPQRCSESSPGTALARAAELEVMANGKRERSPFFAREGIAAVPMYREAAACRRVAADDAAASVDDRDAASLAQRMQDEYKVARLRLERALASKNFDAANTQVKLLRDMLQGKTGDYVAFLSLMERHLLIKSSGSKVGAS